MIRNKLIVTVFALALPAAVACKGKDAGSEEGGASKPADKATAPAAPTWVAIPHMGLAVEMPGAGEVSDTSADAPNASVSAGNTTVRVSTVTEAYPSSYEAARGQIEKEANPFKKFTKEEQTEGGWHLEYELESMMDKAPLYGVQIRSTIDGKQYECGSNERDQAARDAIAKACASLKKQ
jgi:hypothetical protein